MPAYRKASIRELVSAAHELELGVVEGRVLRSPDDGGWVIGDNELGHWLSRYEGQEVVLIVASLEDDRPVTPRICRTCGTEYVGIACPRCREARIRLRGR